MNQNYTKKDLIKLPFRNQDLDIDKRVEDLLGRFTLQEKFRILSGKRFFFTKPIKRLGIPSFKMTDGPHGLGTGIFLLKKVTYFPVTKCRASTWNPELSEEFGKAIAEEVRATKRHMLLAPGLNIDRTPLCGRTFEYQTEDPYLNSILAVAMVNAVQNQRIAACVKHFACNNQEFNRHKVNAIIDERTLREIYLPAFESSVREANAWSIMTCYNKVNGYYGSEHKDLLTERLINEWNFNGFIVSDWWATRYCDTAQCMNAGLSLEMPKNIVYEKKKLQQAFDEGKFSLDILNKNIKRLLKVMILTGLLDNPKSLPKGNRNSKQHQQIARKIAEEGIILLKNENKILPLNMQEIKTIAVLGPNTDKKMSLGGGSAIVRALYEITPLKGLKNKCMNKIRIIKNPIEADVVIYIGGLNHKKNMDKENSDRLQLELPEQQINEIKNISEQNSKIIVILINGSPIAMDPWLEKVTAVIEAWYPGMEGGNVIADILFGDVNPSGKLPITFPKKLSDCPAHVSESTYPGKDNVCYDEGIYIGYRYFDSNNIEPLFPFGFGLSYSTFSFENLNIDKKQISTSESFTVSLDIKNIGDRAGAEVAQLYIHDIKSSVDRPIKELKGFKKVFLNSGEKKRISFKLGIKELSFFDIINNIWKAEKGEFKILVGNSSRDIILEDKVEYIG